MLESQLDRNGASELRIVASSATQSTGSFSLVAPATALNDEEWTWAGPEEPSLVKAPYQASQHPGCSSAPLNEPEPPEPVKETQLGVFIADDPTANE